MTRADLNEMFYAIDNVRSREKRFCEEYCKLNPDDRQRREADRDLILCALNSVEYEIKRRYKALTA